MSIDRLYLHDTLHAHLLRVSWFVPVGNMCSETVVKTLSHGLIGPHRRAQQYASMLVAARHRPQLWPMSDTDYA